jgi:hypothetical protein
MSETPLRVLGDASMRQEPAATREPAPESLRRQALELLLAEFAKALEMKHRLDAETGDTEATAAKRRGIVASLEGANRLALKLGLIDVTASRELFARAQRDGLYEGWR